MNTKQHPINNLGDFTLKEISDKLGITRERVRQIEQIALKKIKCPKVSKQLRKYLDL